MDAARTLQDYNVQRWNVLVVEVVGGVLGGARGKWLKSETCVAPGCGETLRGSAFAPVKSMPQSSRRVSFLMSGWRGAGTSR